MSAGIATLLLACSLGSSVPAVSPALEQAFRGGIAAYDAQDWDAAIAAWEGLGRFRVQHPAVEYNLGNAYVKKRDYGRAVLHYERALRLEPGDSEAAENLQLVRGLLVDEVGPDASVLARFLDEVMRRVPIEEVAVVAFVSWQLLGLAVLVALLRAGPLRRAAVGIAVLAALLLAIAAPLFWLELGASRDHSRMVVLAPAVEARSGPGEQYTTSFTVHEGLVVRSRESAQGWERVELLNGLSGWLPTGSLERI